LSCFREVRVHEILIGQPCRSTEGVFAHHGPVANDAVPLISSDLAEINLPDFVTSRVAHAGYATLVVYEIDHEWILMQNDLALTHYLIASCIHPSQKERRGLNEGCLGLDRAGEHGECQSEELSPSVHGREN